MNKSEIRILHITNTLTIGGVQKVIYQLCNGTRNEFAKVVVASTGGEYVEKLMQIGVDHFKIGDITNKKPNNIYKIYRSIAEIVRKYDINIIHCHHRMAVFYAKLFKNKAKIIYNNHTIYSDQPKLTHYLLRGIHIIADGVKAKENVVSFFGIPDKNVVVINNAVDFYSGEKTDIPEILNRKERGDFIVLNSSRLHSQKGVNYYIDAAKILTDKGYRISFFIVGDGELHNQIVEQIKRLGLEDKVVLLGFRQDIKNVIVQADVLVLTSIYEGLPLTPMEAFSVSKAVIATDIDGTREVVEDGYDGLLAETKNPTSIAEKIERVYLDRAFLEKLDGNAYKAFEKKFSIEPFIRRYIDFYESI